MKASIVLTLFTAVSIGISGCDFTAAEEAFNEFDVIIALDEVNSFVALSIVDGQTQDFVQQPVNVRFLGEDADHVIDMFSDPISDIDVSGGLGTFGISNVITPSAAEPVSVRISVSTNGYEPNSATLSMNSTGRTDAQIVLVRENQGLAGSESGSGSGNADASGDVTEAFRAVTTPHFTNQAEAGVLLPAGTHGSTESGASAEGQLRADIIYYTANTSSSSLAFPGGFQTPVLRASGSLEETTLTTAGFMTITVTDENGQEITQFDPPIELSMEIEPSTINPLTGNPVQNGDHISYFSYDEDRAVWIEEGDSELSGPGTDGNYYAAFLTSHLTTWSAGYMDNGCSSGVFSVERNGNEGSIFARASSASAGWFGRTIVIPQGDSEFIVADAPGFLTDFEVFFELGGQQRIIQQSNSICGAAGVASFDPPFNQVDVTFSMDLGPQCPALRVNNVPTFAIYYKLPLESDASATPVGSQPDFVLDSLGRITGGSLLVPGLELGQTYRFYTTINNEREERDIRISGDQVVFDISQDVLDADICASN